MEVRILQAADEPRWTDFVSRHPGATLYHTLDWREVLTRVFGHRPQYLWCEDGGRVLGVLPLFRVSLPLVGSKLISIPYDIGSGGPLAEDDRAERELASRAMELAREQRVGFLEMRCGAARPALERLELERGEPVILSDVALDDREAVWGRIAKDHQKSIKKADRRGVTVREADGLEDYLKFYRVYLKVFRDFGTPPYAERYFRTLWEVLHPSGGVRLFVAEAGGRYLGALQLFCWHRRLVSKFAACLPEAVPLRAYPALYWRAMEWGLDNGYEHLSWGTSSRAQSGLIEFKERWGAYSHPAVFYGLPVRGALPDVEKYYESGGLARAVWRRLPLGITPFLGGLINRWFC